MDRLYVTDTNSLVSYFHDVFGRDSGLSAKARRIIMHALDSSPSGVGLSIPAVVFLEIFEKWFTDEEFARKFHYEIFEPIALSPNIEIKPIDQEVLENLLKIRGDLSHHDIHDKIILASAMMLQCPLITTDEAIIKYVTSHRVIPSIIS